LPRRFTSSAPAPSNPTPFPWVQLRTYTSSPFIYEKMVRAVDPQAKAGDFVALLSKEGELFAYGYYQTRSLIRVRICAYSEEVFKDEDDFLRQRLQQALHLREKQLKLAQHTEAYRLIHAEGDRLPGLILERYGDYLVGELFSLAMFLRREKLEQLLKEQISFKGILWRADEQVQEKEGFFLKPDQETPQATLIREYGLRFRIHMQKGHKTGFFCDQRENRQRLTRYTSQETVLDICSYTGGFGIYALALGQAQEVTCVDLDEQAIEWGQQNANLNQQNQQKIHFIHADGFSYLRQMKINQKEFGVVIVDPPKLIGSRDGFTLGRQKYLDFNKLALGITRAGGVLLTCSCSGLLSLEQFLDIVKQASYLEKRRIQILEITGPGADHPQMVGWPESSYLKALWLRVF
jgi:23S rRNA (cytosine1962-C5)-methyltransferase